MTKMPNVYKVIALSMTNPEFHFKLWAWYLTVYRMISVKPNHNYSYDAADSLKHFCALHIYNCKYIHNETTIHTGVYWILLVAVKI